MMRIATAAALASLTALASCGTKSCNTKERPATDSLRIDEVTEDDMRAERARIAAGEIVGERLQSPKVELDYRGVSVNGRVVAAPSDIDAGDLSPIAPLASWLGGLREHWRAIHPTEDFAGTIDLDASSEADAIAGESIIATAFLNGYSRVRVKVDDAAFDANRTHPQVPGEPDDTKRRVRFRIRRALVGWEIDVLVPGPCDSRPTVKSRVLKADALGDIIDEVCHPDDRCMVSIESSPGALSTVVKLLAPAFAGKRPTNVTLDMSSSDQLDRATAAPSARPPLGAPLKKPAKIATGAVQVNGRLPPDAVEAGARTKLDAVRACYEDELRRASTFAGRVVVKLAIDASGAVAQACDAGSDRGGGEIVACIVQVSSKLTFPAPGGGIVTAVIPFVLSPG